MAVLRDIVQFEGWFNIAIFYDKDAGKTFFIRGQPLMISGAEEIKKKLKAFLQKKKLKAILQNKKNLKGPSPGKNSSTFFIALALLSNLTKRPR